jgi:hypothetical protein
VNSYNFVNLTGVFSCGLTARFVFDNFIFTLAGHHLIPYFLVMIAKKIMFSVLKSL